MRRQETLSEERHVHAVEALTQWGGRGEVIESNRPYQDREWSGRRLPSLHLEDVSDIPFVSTIPGVELYQHRARVRAFDEDLFAAVTLVSEGYEPYCQEFLNLQAPGLVVAEPTSKGLMAVSQACMEGAALEQISAWANQHGEVALHPYMSIEDVWTLASRLKLSTTANIEVIGPPPAALWVANDKAALSEIVSLVLGDEWLVDTKTAHSPETIAQRLAESARAHEWVGLKRTRCASAMGNRVYKSSDIKPLDIPTLTAKVREFLVSTEWEGDEEVLIVEWVQTDESPSTQIWIPPLGHGQPILEGVYEQLLEGEEKCFLGSRPSVLPAPVNRAIGEASLAVAAAFQELGYTGRCSFDFIVSGDLDGDFKAQFTECNGRWGGTSTPMFLMDRLMPSHRPHYIAQDYQRASLEGATFGELRAALEPMLFDPKTQQGRFVLYNVGPLAGSGKFDVISIGREPDEAMEGIQIEIPKLLGLS